MGNRDIKAPVVAVVNVDEQPVGQIHQDTNHGNFTAIDTEGRHRYKGDFYGDAVQALISEMDTSEGVTFDIPE